MNWCVVLPSLKVSGGVLEAVRLAEALQKNGPSSELVAMWSTPHPIATSLPVRHLARWNTRAELVPVQYPILIARFANRVRSQPAARQVFTHYTTMPLAFTVARRNRFFFLQDLEWRFVGTWLMPLLRAFILFAYRRGHIISANSYLTACLRAHGVPVRFEAPIWANPAFASDGSATRDIDFAMVIRKGKHKRLDLYHAFLDRAASARMRVAVISTEDELISRVRERVAFAVVRPSLDEMRDIYSRSKCFIHLSDHEGFGLPPLEAMGAGCVPLCRDSGGVRVYMNEGLQELVMPLEAPIEVIFTTALSLVRNESMLKRLQGLCRAIFGRGARTSEGCEFPVPVSAD